MSTTNIGKTLYVAEALPATNTAGAFAGLTWVKVNGVQSIGGIGISHSGIDVPDLQTGFTTQMKGAGAGTDSSMTFRNIAADAGQIDVKGLAEDSTGLGSIKIVTGSGTNEAPVQGDPVIYAQGIFHSYLPNEDSTTSYDGWSATFRNNAPAVSATQPAP